MTKKQVILMSFVVAVPALALLTMLVLNGMSDGGKMFSGMMTVIVAITGLLVLGLGLSPFAVMAFYPAEGFKSLAPPPPAPSASPSRVSDDDDDDFGVADDDGETDDFEDDEFAVADDDSETFEDSYDESYADDDYEDGGFEDEEEWT